MFDELITKIEEYYEKRGLCKPNSKDAVMFLTCECGELQDAILRTDPKWVRNNVKPPDLEGELADTLMMIFVVARTLNIDPVEALLSKMERKLRESTAATSR